MAALGTQDCRKFATAYLASMDAQQAAQAIGAQEGIRLLERPEVCAQISKQRDLLCQSIKPEDIWRYLVCLAFGRANDCVKLVLQQDVDIDRLDLRLLSELKRSEKGTVEIKLIDRVRVLEYLNAGASATAGEAAAFFRAMEQMCQED